MKHIARVSKPAMAAQAGPLTNWNKPTPGLLGINEVGDWVLWLGTLADTTVPWVSKWNIMPTAPAISKSGNGGLD
jgi:hypothetical protein